MEKVCERKRTRTEGKINLPRLAFWFFRDIFGNTSPSFFKCKADDVQEIIQTEV